MVGQLQNGSPDVYTTKCGQLHQRKASLYQDSSRSLSGKLVASSALRDWLLQNKHVF